MDQLTVLYLCDDLGAEAAGTGWERLLARLLPLVATTRYQPVVVGLGRKPQAPILSETSSVAVSHLGRSRIDPASVTAVLKVLDQVKPHVLHLHGPSASTFGRIAGALRRLPVVLQQDHEGQGKRSSLARTVDRFLAPWTDVALASSRGAAAFAVQACSLPAARVKVMDAGEDSLELLAARLDRLYRLLSRTPRSGRRPGVLPEDLAFLEERPQR